MRIKPPTAVTLAPFSSNWATHKRKSAVQLQAHVHLLHCVIRLFVNKMWQSVDKMEGRKQGQSCFLQSVWGWMLITWQPQKISKLRPEPLISKGLMMDRWAFRTKHIRTHDSLKPEWCAGLGSDKIIRKVPLRRRAATRDQQLKLLRHLWHCLMTLICNLTSWTLADD